jgi:ABC-2 type transport system ATP-binding protein
MQQDVTALEVADLTRSFRPGRRALDGLSLTVPAGSVFGLVGLNGAGKTTTIRIVAGLERRDGGIVRLFGRDVVGLDVPSRQRLGFVLDEALYFDWMPVRNYLEFVGTMYGLSPEEVNTRVCELLDFFDLSPHEAEPIGLFSTGMKKKVSLAAAIIHSPDLLILDEPLDGIDPIAAGAVKRTLGLIAARGGTVLITSHVLDTVEKLCTAIAIIHQGKTLMQCGTEEVRQRARSSLRSSHAGPLEDLFVELVAGHLETRSLSWL